jgi:hypothetical protein
VTRRVFGRPLWARRDAGPRGSAYPVRRWLLETVSAMRDMDVLEPAAMRTAGLYDEKRLQALLTPSEGGLSNEALNGRILTVEMALRAVTGRLPARDRTPGYIEA